MAAGCNGGPEIPRFYAGRSVFITGASGFMGKVLLERLLTTCPDIRRLYLLMRTKKNVSPDLRLQQLKQSQVFDNIRESNPAQLDKLVLIPGDISEPVLGMSTESLTLIQEVSIVIHSAATLKFDEELRLAVNQNVRSAMRMLEICDQLPFIEALVHVSTSYSNSECDNIEERVYPPPADFEQLLAMVDAVPPHLLSEITPKYISPKPNTYTFTKAVAESMVERHGNRGYPIAIFRPSIVIASLQNPFPGWTDSLNGPSSVIVAAGKGLLHYIPCKAHVRADMIPVDIAIDTLIAVAWETAVDNSKEIRVYNCCTAENPTTWGALATAVKEGVRRYPLDKALWYPFGGPTENPYIEKIYEIFLQTIPLRLAEYGIRLFGIKTRLNLITIDQRIKATHRVNKFFTTNEFCFETGNVRRLRERLSPEDAKIYNIDVNSINWEQQYVNFIKGARRYLLQEKDQDIQKAKSHMRRMWLLHNSVLLISFLLSFRLLLRNAIFRGFVYRVLTLLSSLSLSLFHSTRSRLTGLSAA